MIVVYAITMYGLLVTRDDSGFPIKDGWFKAKRGSGGLRADSFYPSDEYAASCSCVYRAKKFLNGAELTIILLNAPVHRGGGFHDTS